MSFDPKQKIEAEAGISQYPRELSVKEDEELGV